MVTPPSAHPALIYKVLRPAEWAELEAVGQFAGSPDDRRDGFIHLSTAEQLETTIAKHFAGESEVIVLEFAAASFGGALRWEASRGGALFPHVYGVLPASAARIVPRPVDSGHS